MKTPLQELLKSSDTDTPSEEELLLAGKAKFEHFPEATGRQMALLQGVHITGELHAAFAESVAFSGNKKFEVAQSEIAKKKSLPWSEYWHLVKGAKDLNKWKKAATDHGTPAEDTEAASKVDEAGALAFIRFLHTQDSNVASSAGSRLLKGGKKAD